MSFLLPAIAAGAVAGAAYFFGEPTKDSMGSTGVGSTGVGSTGSTGLESTDSTIPMGIGNLTEISTITPNLKEKITETSVVTDTPHAESEEPKEPSKEPSEEPEPPAPEEQSPETAAKMTGGGKELKGGAIGVPNWGRNAKMLIKDSSGATTVVSQGDLFTQLNKLNEEISEIEQKEKEASFYSLNSNVELKGLYEKNKEKIIKSKKNEERRNFLINILKNSVNSNTREDKTLVGGKSKGKGNKKQEAQALYNTNNAFYEKKYGKDRSGNKRTQDQILELIIQNELGGGNQQKQQITEEDRKKKEEELAQLEYEIRVSKLEDEDFNKKEKLLKERKEKQTNILEEVKKVKEEKIKERNIILEKLGFIYTENKYTISPINLIQSKKEYIDATKRVVQSQKDLNDFIKNVINQGGDPKFLDEGSKTLKTKILIAKQNLENVIQRLTKDLSKQDISYNSKVVLDFIGNIYEIIGYDTIEKTWKKPPSNFLQQFKNLETSLQDRRILQLITILEQTKTRENILQNVDRYYTFFLKTINSITRQDPDIFFSDGTNFKSVLEDTQKNLLGFKKSIETEEPTDSNIPIDTEGVMLADYDTIYKKVRDIGLRYINKHIWLFNNFYNLLELTIKTYQQRDNFYKKLIEIRDSLTPLKFKFINTDENSIINKCQQILKPEAYKFLSYEKTKKLEDFNDKSLEDIIKDDSKTNPDTINFFKQIGFFPSDSFYDMRYLVSNIVKTILNEIKIAETSLKYSKDSNIIDFFTDFYSSCNFERKRIQWIPSVVSNDPTKHFANTSPRLHPIPPRVHSPLPTREILLHSIYPYLAGFPNSFLDPTFYYYRIPPQTYPRFQLDETDEMFYLNDTLPPPDILPSEFDLEITNYETLKNFILMLLKNDCILRAEQILRKGFMTYHFADPKTKKIVKDKLKFSFNWYGEYTSNASYTAGNPNFIADSVFPPPLSPLPLFLPSLKYTHSLDYEENFEGISAKFFKKEFGNKKIGYFKRVWDSEKENLVPDIENFILGLEKVLEITDSLKECEFQENLLSNPENTKNIILNLKLLQTFSKQKVLSSVLTNFIKEQEMNGIINEQRGKVSQGKLDKVSIPLGNLHEKGFEEDLKVFTIIEVDIVPRNIEKSLIASFLTIMSNKFRSIPYNSKTFYNGSIKRVREIFVDLFTLELEKTNPSFKDKIDIDATTKKEKITKLSSDEKIDRLCMQFDINIYIFTDYSEQTKKLLVKEHISGDSKNPDKKILFMFQDRDNVFYPIVIVDDVGTQIKFSNQPFVRNTNLQRYFGGSKIEVIAPSSTLPTKSFRLPFIEQTKTKPEYLEEGTESTIEEEHSEESENKLPENPEEAAKFTGGYKRYLPRKTPRILLKRNKTKRFLY